jgi:hypothetical protein
MTLDWYIQSKPIHGCEDIFESLQGQIESFHQRSKNINTGKPIEDEILGCSVYKDIENLEAELLKVSILPGEISLRPTYGEKKCADPRDENDKEILKKYFNPEILDDDKSNYFRAQQLKISDNFPEELKKELYISRNAMECIEFANKMEKICAIKFKGQTDLFGLVDPSLPSFEWDDDSKTDAEWSRFDEDIKLIKKSIEFLRWWGSHGHGLRVSY